MQGELEGIVTRLANRPVRVLGSGRTDRGVHAIAQVATVDLPVRWTPDDLRRAINALLPPDVWIAGAWRVDPRFHPRYDAISRSYLYRVGLAERTASPFHARWCWPVRKKLDVELLTEATQHLLGEHSFRRFAKAGQEERGDRCILTEARWEQWDDLGLLFRVSANRFLHHMVRYMVGTLVAVGSGVRPVADLSALLANDSDLLTSPPAPPEGLFLANVRYPPPPYGPAMAEPIGIGADLPNHI
ncbi:tRNA pseudouridine(38-40) synthase TruA [soil metagenome]